MNKELAILIVAFKRPLALRELLSEVIKGDEFRIYIALDAPRTTADHSLHLQCLDVINSFKASYSGLVNVRVAPNNLGCAASVILGCRWVFSLENFVAILEDDCLPNQGFFRFVNDAKEFLDSDPRVLMASGSQFSPLEITNEKWAYSKYAQVWGWATTKNKWSKIEQLLLSESLRHTSNGWKLPDLNYWKAGARRALNGYVDAWDTPLVYFMQKGKYLALLPGQNLIKNIGDDSVATHTGNPSPWIRLTRSEYQHSSLKPVQNHHMDTWLRDNFYKISARHIISTKISLAFDLARIRKKVRKKLRSRV